MSAKSKIKAKSKSKKILTKRDKTWISQIRFLILASVCFVIASFFFLSFQNLKNERLQTNHRTIQASSSAKLTNKKNNLIPQAKAQFLSSTSSASLPENSGRLVNVPIIYYHYIGNNPNPANKTRDNLSVAPDLFEKQMAYLSSNGYSTISLDTLYAALKGQVSLPAKPIIVTFDDGYIDFYVNAFPILRRYGLHATAFIPTGLMDQGYYLHWSQIKEMDATGLISFQAHSVNHLTLTALSPDQLTHQLIDSKKALESELGKPVNFMAYPYGVSDSRVWEATKQAGFLGSVGTWFGTTESEGNIFDMPRIKIAGSGTIEDFKKRF